VTTTSSSLSPLDQSLPDHEPGTSPSYSRAPLSDETRQEIRRLRAEGLSHAQIAARVGVSKSVIGRTLNPALREKYRLRRAQWYAENAEEIRRKAREYEAAQRDANREHKNARARDWRRRHHEELLEVERQYRLDHPLYATYRSMWTRCTNPGRDSWPYYGGRGITVEFASLEEYEQHVYALPPCIHGYSGEPPEGKCPERCSIDRIDNDGNYEPGNLRWATAREQVLNQRRVYDEIERQIAAEGSSSRAKAHAAARRAEADAADRVDTKQAAAMLGIGYRSLFRWLDSGKLEYQRDHGDFRFDREYIEAQAAHEAAQAAENSAGAVAE
jgi:transposase